MNLDKYTEYYSLLFSLDTQQGYIYDTVKKKKKKKKTGKYTESCVHGVGEIGELT